jgi:mRNA interferase MazF
MSPSVFSFAQGSVGSWSFKVAVECRGYGWLEVRRGEIVTIVLPGAYGKPRPGLVVQSDLFDELGSITILPITSELRTAPLLRIPVEPTDANGLRRKSQIMIDKTQTVPRDKVGSTIGKLDANAIVAVDRALATFLGIA